MTFLRTVAGNTTAALLGIVAALLMVELSATAFYLFENGTIYWLSPPHEASPPPGLSVQTSRQKLLPYLGFNLRPGWHAWEDISLDNLEHLLQLDGEPDWWTWPANNYGFISPFDYPFHPPEADAYIIGVVGGSVARAFSLQARPLFISMLRDALALGKRPIYLVNLAAGGYKEPQQLLTLAYFISIGQRLDLIVNIDGFNEAWVSWYNLNSNHVATEMPFNGFVWGLENYFLDVEHIKAENAGWLAASARRLDRWRQTTRLTTIYYLAEASRKYIVSRSLGREEDFAKPMPGVDYPEIMIMDSASYDERLDHVADLWLRSSLAINALAGSIGARYIHILQPNQYYSHKKFSDAERKLALTSSLPLSRLVPLLYDALRARAPLLQNSGVEFIDGSAAFDDTSQQTYSDDCCHYIQAGYDLFVQHIVAAMTSASPGSKTPVK